MPTRRIFGHRLKKNERDEKQNCNDESKIVSSLPPDLASQSSEEDLFVAMEGADFLNPDMDRDNLQEWKEDLTNAENSGGFSVEEIMATVTWQSEDEKKEFEEQLTQLQEQMMMVMIENQALHNELSVKVKTEIKQMKAALAYERQRCEVLQKNLDSSNKRKWRKFHRSSSEKSQHLSPSASTASLPHVGSLSSLEEQDDIADDGVVENNAPPDPPRLYSRLLHTLVELVREFLEDDAEESPGPIETPPEESFSIRKLRGNINRFGEALKPYIDTARGVGMLFAWKSPLYTLIVFMMFTYIAWHGWIFPAFFFCLAFRLFMNYLRYLGLNVSFNFFEPPEETKEPVERVLGISGRVNLVMSVARRVQNSLGAGADALEKIKSLLTWRHPQASRQLLLAICIVFLVFCILPIDNLLNYGGLLLGIGLFPMNYLYIRFPRLRRLNSNNNSNGIWQELPTDSQYEERQAKSDIDKHTFHQNSWDRESQADAKSEQGATDDRTFCELFSLPETESPLPGWRDGRHCALINKEKSLVTAAKIGRLFLTHSFLCFKRTNMPSLTNIVIPLTDIIRLEKAKLHRWIPGNGMAIEIDVRDNDRKFIFGRLLHRNDVYNSIREASEKKQREGTQDDNPNRWMEERNSSRKRYGVREVSL